MPNGNRAADKKLHPIPTCRTPSGTLELRHKRLSVLHGQRVGPERHQRVGHRVRQVRGRHRLDMNRYSLPGL